MAIGDAAAAQGLVVYPSSQSRALGYQNDNQRGDDVAATMTRLDTIEGHGTNKTLTSFTPSWTGLTPGTGSVITYAKYNIENGVVSGFVSLKLGTSLSVGDVFMSFPVAVTGSPAWLGTGIVLGVAQFVDASGGPNRYQGIIQAGATQMHVEVEQASGAYASSTPIGSTVPFTWAVNDLIQLTFSYPLS